MTWYRPSLPKPKYPRHIPQSEHPDSDSIDDQMETSIFSIILTLVGFDVWTLSWIITLEAFQKKNAPFFWKDACQEYPPFPGFPGLPTFQTNGTEKPTERLHRRHRDAGRHSAGLGGALRGLLQSSAGVLWVNKNLLQDGFSPKLL